MRSRALLALVALAFAACIRVSTLPLEPARASVAVDSVRVFTTHAPDDYTELAILRTVGLWASDARALSALRKRAAQLGANGLLLPGSLRGTGASVIVGRRTGQVVADALDTDADQFERAVAIIYNQR